MSRKERDRLKVIEQLDKRLISQAKAARLLALSERQVRRVLARWRREGDAGLVHRLRGRPAHNRLVGALREQVLKLIGEQYNQWGPTLVSEHLRTDHRIVLSRETVRQWMLAKGLWELGRPPRPHRRHRPRRECVGELVQMDTSQHDWFEGRGEQADLILMIDDATSRVRMRFYAADTTAANMDLIGRWIGAAGRPLALYVDFASHFKQLGRRGQRRAQRIQTQIERALGELDIEMINARSPQAKGRVERAFGTLQDRLVKELRLRSISTIEAANRFLDEEFIAFWNERFAVAAANPLDAHRSAAGCDLTAILSIQQTRRVNNDYTIQFGGRWFQIERGADGGRLAGRRVLVEERLDGTLRIRWEGEYLAFKEVVKVGPAVATAAAGLGAALREDSLRSPSLRSAPNPAAANGKPITVAHANKPSADHPWKRTFLLCRK